MITRELLEKIAPRTKNEVLDKFVEPLNSLGEKYGILENNKRVASFLAQIAHESGGFNFTKENLNYSENALNAVFGKYFKDVDAADYARQPEKIASRVYADRMGNGDEESGDGWKYRGRGLIQLTGKNNYSKFAEDNDMSLEEVVDYLETDEGAVASAVWFWDTNNLNRYADDDDFVGLTKRINGGTNGLEDRQHHYEVALESLEA